MLLPLLWPYSFSVSPNSRAELFLVKREMPFLPNSHPSAISPDRRGLSALLRNYLSFVFPHTTDLSLSVVHFYLYPGDLSVQKALSFFTERTWNYDALSRHDLGGISGFIRSFLSKLDTVNNYYISVSFSFVSKSVPFETPHRFPVLSRFR